MSEPQSKQQCLDTVLFAGEQLPAGVDLRSQHGFEVLRAMAGKVGDVPSIALQFRRHSLRIGDDLAWLLACSIAGKNLLDGNRAIFEAFVCKISKAASLNEILLAGAFQQIFYPGQHQLCLEQVAADIAGSGWSTAQREELWITSIPTTTFFLSVNPLTSPVSEELVSSFAASLKKETATEGVLVEIDAWHSGNLQLAGRRAVVFLRHITNSAADRPTDDVFKKMAQHACFPVYGRAEANGFTQAAFALGAVSKPFAEYTFA